MNLCLTVEFPRLLDLMSTAIGLRTCSRSPKYTELSYFTLLFCRGRLRNIQRTITHVHNYCSSYKAFCFLAFSLPLPSWFAQGPSNIGIPKQWSGSHVGRVTVDLFFYENTFCFNKFARILARWVKIFYFRESTSGILGTGRLPLVYLRIFTKSRETNLITIKYVDGLAHN